MGIATRAAPAPDVTHEAAGLREAWAESARAVLARHGTNPERGLGTARVREQRLRYGENRLRRRKRRSAWRVLVAQFASVMVLLLVVASLVAFLLVDPVDGAAIAVVIVINVAIGFFTELRAARSMEALYRLGEVTARVCRDGRVAEIPAVDLVPGDLLLFEGGDVVAADVRLVSGSMVQADESALTGESAPVDKTVEPVPAGTPLAERASMLHKGTAVTRGAGSAVVVSTGLHTELGRITSLTEETESGETPLERRLELLGRRLVWISLVVTAAVALAGIAAGRDVVLMVETALALAVATVPEGLPIVATLALARGMWRMARRNALVTRLSAVEALGATGVICADKTGTLTENRMTVARLALPGGDYTLGEGRGPPFARDGAAADPHHDSTLREALALGALCNNAHLNGTRAGGAVGDPMEAALLVAAAKGGVDRERLLAEQPEAREEAFDSATRMMATFHRAGDGVRVAVKGSPEAVIAACARERHPAGDLALDSGGRARWLARNEALADEGLRVLALATRDATTADEDPYRDLAFVGLVGLRDPPRADVPEAIARCRAAGIKVVMVTGDQAVTARHVATAVGLTDTGPIDVVPGEALDDLERLTPGERARLRQATVIARVSPKQKLRLVELHQAAGEIVAMTGDGVNDAPALKRADIGVAMGERGTQVAREAADIVLKDDAFPTIASAVEQGRVIFDNIRKFVLYLLSCNLSEVLIVGLATVLATPLPILPLQILFLNVVTDVFPALALGFGQGDPRIMLRKPRPADEPVLTRRHWTEVVVYGGLITASVLGAFGLARGWLALDPAGSVTVSFLTLALAQLWQVFNVRDPGGSLARSDVARNPFVWGALALSGLLLVGAVYLPAAAGLLDLATPGGSAWAVILGFSLLPLVAGQAWIALRALGGGAATGSSPRTSAS